MSNAELWIKGTTSSSKVKTIQIRIAKHKKVVFSDHEKKIASIIHGRATKVGSKTKAFSEIKKLLFTSNFSSI